VRVDAETLGQESARAAAEIHGISDEEILTGMEFARAWLLLVAWVEDVLNMAVTEGEESEEEDDPRPPRLSAERPLVLLAGHNIFKFDCPFLIFECLRHNVSCQCMQDWVFADTLHVFQALQHGCPKLQCLVHTWGSRADLRAHRALDDVVALRHVTTALAEHFGLSLPALLRRFACELDFVSSTLQVAAML